MRYPTSLTLLLVLGALPAAAEERFLATLEGAQEVPPVATTASGSASLTLDATETELGISLTIVGLDLDGLQTPENAADDVTGIHIHAAPAGANGGVVFGLLSPSHDTDGDTVIDAAAGTVTTGWDESEGNGTTLTAQLASLRSAGLYLNVHTATEGGGEIRGQIEPVLFADGFESGDAAAWAAASR